MAVTTYTVELTEAQQKALEYVAVDPAEWIRNVVHNRCRMAMEDIYNSEIERMTNDPNITAIPADKNQVVLDADIQTAAEAEAASSEELTGA